MSFDAIEKYNTRLLIPKETIMFATVAVLSNGRQKDETKEHVHRESPLTSCVLFLGRLPGPIFIRKICFRCRRSKYEKLFTYKSENICTWLCLCLLSIPRDIVL